MPTAITSLISSLESDHGSGFDNAVQNAVNTNVKLQAKLNSVLDQIQPLVLHNGTAMVQQHVGVAVATVFMDNSTMTLGNLTHAVGAVHTGLSTMNHSSTLPAQSAQEFRLVFDSFSDNIAVVVPGLDEAVSAYGSAPMDFGVIKFPYASESIAVALVFQSLHRHITSCLTGLQSKLATVPSVLNSTFVSTIAQETYECGALMASINSLQDSNGVKLELQHNKDTDKPWPSSQERMRLEEFTTRLANDVPIARTTMSQLISKVVSRHEEDTIDSVANALVSNDLFFVCTDSKPCFIGTWAASVFDNTQQCVEKHISDAHSAVLDRARKSASEAKDYFKSHVENIVLSECQTRFEGSVASNAVSASNNSTTKTYLHSFAIETLDKPANLNALENVVVANTNAVLQACRLDGTVTSSSAASVH